MVRMIQVPMNEEDAIGDTPALVPSIDGYSINDLHEPLIITIESTSSSLLSPQVVPETTTETTVSVVQEGYQSKTLLDRNYQQNKRWSILPKFPSPFGSTVDTYKCLLLSNVPCEYQHCAYVLYSFPLFFIYSFSLTVII